MLIISTMNKVYIDHNTLILPKEAAELLKVSEYTIIRYLTSGKLRGTKLPGRHWRVYYSSVQEITEKGKNY